ncbi:MAG TPA: hypothetical protein VHZ55_12200, partial [Bryobacteraceae bacterium]|nr:hypothetical protein [Bryobacteraceae bacterium]
SISGIQREPVSPRSRAAIRPHLNARVSEDRDISGSWKSAAENWPRDPLTIPPEPEANDQVTVNNLLCFGIIAA